MISNLDIYLAVAEEAFAEMERLDNASRTPRPDGEAGFIIKLDPEQKSLKQAMIVIAFSAMYFEALLFITASKKFGRRDVIRMDKKDRPTYKEKLERIGVTDQTLLTQATNFSQARNDLIHEKAVDASEISDVKFRFAQKVAKESLPFVRRVRDQLQLIGSSTY